MSLERLVALAGRAGAADRAAAAASRAGAVAGRRRGEGTDIFDLRPFQDGDDPRHLDPAATARSGRPQLRTFHEEVEKTALLVADLRAPMFWGSRGRLRSVAAAEALALEGWSVVAAGGRVGLHAVRDGETSVAAPRPREAALLGLLATLARLHAAGLEADPAAPGPELSEILDRAAASVTTGAALILATGFDRPGADFDAVARAVLRKCRLTVLLVQDPLETAPPAGVFTIRRGRAAQPVRFSGSEVPARLDALGIATRLVRSDEDPLAQACA
ncbi:DUF58 domain-containing protein (plasmid) [Paroceanicella profunda]|uniref:DUF58 domain-containing protein n=1 Tax=Paroceanicella profunda TaxID=2579971 RepID=A0A5B8G4A4_9RHOB|nr:DUF58 domain-containing protein [Paroceanicella profunda]